MHRGAAEAPFAHRHLLGIEGLSPDDINQFLDLADGYVELNRQAEKKRSTLRGRTIVNCFFESSTRTRTSFELAGTDMLITSPPSRLPASSNDVRVRVELSKKQLTIVRPRSVLRFFSACRFSST